jgi:hypothetical protein
VNEVGNPHWIVRIQKWKNSEKAHCLTGCVCHALTLALVSALLGDEQNGCWRIAPAQPWQKASQAYRKDTFLPCSFWLVDCLCLMERQAEARALFQRLLAVCSSLGLLSEEYDAKKQRQVGNLPQAFSHVGLINADRSLSEGHGASHHRSRQ